MIRINERNWGRYNDFIDLLYKLDLMNLRTNQAMWDGAQIVNSDLWIAEYEVVPDED